MAKSNDSDKELGSNFKRKAAVVIPDEEAPTGALGVTDVLAWRRWFNERQKQLRSSGGRPTNPAWSMKRQIPFAVDVWSELEKRADACSERGSKIAPGQMAAFLIEEALLQEESTLASDRARTDPPELTNDPRFDQWRLRGVFAGRGAS